ncbi:hypothetical protein [Streptomyces halstedii]|uniref:hypothetical protein n=1 Tax=Streptomyces halstedii TaxID=1944 RepID=UPI00334DFB4D
MNEQNRPQAMNRRSAKDEPFPPPLRRATSSRGSWWAARWRREAGVPPGPPALSDHADIDAVTADVRASLAADIERARRACLDSAPPGGLDADPIGAAALLAFSALRAAGAALPEFRSGALGRLGQTEEADAEERLAYKTEQRLRWFRHNPNGADAVAAATKAADTARNALPSTCLRPG